MRNMFFLLFISTIAFAQPRISRVEKLPLDKTQEWSNPVFSPDGKRIYFTTASFQGIWEYDPAKKVRRQVVDDPASGYSFSFSSDGKSIAYRRTRYEGVNRVQEIVVKELSSGASRIIGSGENLSTPTFAGTAVLYTDDAATKNLDGCSVTSKPVLLGIENTKISLVDRGEKRLLDPLGGSYVWPELNPEGTKLVATEMAGGAFVADLAGKVLARLGKRNGATWARSGKWLIYMNDKDDGHVIQSSDLFCVSPDGKIARQLTATRSRIELNPKCSPTENKIVCNTLGREILVLTYAEAK